MRRYPRARNQRGADLIEYCLLLALISVATISAVNGFAQNTKRAFCGVVAGTDGKSNYDANTGDCLVLEDDPMNPGDGSTKYF